MEVRTREEAWEEVNKIFPTDYEQDTASSERAGYPVYISTADGVNAWISDLNCRLEVNIQDEKTKEITSTSIYIVNKEAEEIEKLEREKDAMQIILDTQTKQIEEQFNQIERLRAELEYQKSEVEFRDGVLRTENEEKKNIYQKLDKIENENKRLKHDLAERELDVIHLKAKLYDLLVKD